MTLTVLTIWSGEWKDLAAIVLPNRDEYCARHGYSHYIRCGYYHDTSWAYTVQKTKWVRDFIAGERFGKCGTDFYWVLDLDALITNLTIPVLNFVDDTHNIFMARDVNGLNCGSYIVRNNAWVIQWYDSILDMRETTTSEQHAMQILNEENEIYKGMMMELPQPSINSIGYEYYPEPVVNPVGQWKAGDLILHLPGMTPDDRIEIFNRYKDRAYHE